MVDPCIKAAVSALPFPPSPEEYGVEFNLECPGKTRSQASTNEPTSQPHKSVSCVINLSL